MLRHRRGPNVSPRLLRCVPHDRGTDGDEWDSEREVGPSLWPRSAQQNGLGGLSRR